MMKKLQIIISICIILVITAVAYLPSLNNGFVNWDDDIYVIENSRIKDLSWENIKRIFTSFQGDLYVPLTLFSFSLEYHFFGLNPQVYHTTNLIFHLLNCLLVFCLIFLLSRRIEVSFIAALFFGVHPLHVESVAWITERKDMLYAFFFLGSSIAYLCYLKNKFVKYYYLSLILFLLSLLSKAQGMCLPFLLLLFDYFLNRKFNWKTLLDKIPFLLISVVFIVVTLSGQSLVGRTGEANSFISLSTILNGIHGFVLYLVKLAVPIRLSCFYPYPDGLGGLIPSLHIFSIFIFVTLTVGVINSGRRTRKIIFAALFFLLNILLVLQLIRTGLTITADRYTYISSIGFFYLLGEGLFWLYRQKLKHAKYLFPAAIAIVTLSLATLTWQRCQAWKNSEVLWRDVLNKYPNASIAHGNLGSALNKQGKLKEALYHHNEALKINPGYPEVHNDLGVILGKLGKFDEAIFHCKEALRIEPDSARTHVNLGIIFAMQGKLNEATIHNLKAIEIKPESAQAYNNLGIDSAAQGRLEEAISYYKKALQIDPDSSEAHSNLGIVLAKQGQFEEAIIYYHEALEIEPNLAEVHNNLGNLLTRQGRFEEALKHFNEALRIRPDSPETLWNRRLTLEKMKERE